MGATPYVAPIVEQMSVGDGRQLLLAAVLSEVGEVAPREVGVEVLTQVVQLAERGVVLGRVVVLAVGGVGLGDVAVVVGVVLLLVVGAGRAVVLDRVAVVVVLVVLVDVRLAVRVVRLSGVVLRAVGLLAVVEVVVLVAGLDVAEVAVVAHCGSPQSLGVLSFLCQEH